MSKSLMGGTSLGDMTAIRARAVQPEQYSRAVQPEQYSQNSTAKAVQLKQYTAKVIDNPEKQQKYHQFYQQLEWSEW